MKIASWKRHLILSLVGVGFAFVWLNTWNVLPCYDCMIPRGRPFAYKVTEGFATAPRLLWGGLFADVAVCGAAALLVFLVLRFFTNRLATKEKGQI